MGSTAFGHLGVVREVKYLVDERSGYLNAAAGMDIGGVNDNSSRAHQRLPLAARPTVGAGEQWTR